MSETNEWSETLADKLHRATSRNLPADAELDAQTAALRDGWLALSQLLEAADAEQPEPVVTLPAAAIAVRPGKLWLAIFALAASLLLVAAGAWLVATRWNTVGGGGSQVATSPQPKDEVSPGVAPVPSNAVANDAINGELAWDDALDDRIADASEAARRVQTVSRGADRDLDFVNWRLEEISRDLATDSL